MDRQEPKRRTAAAGRRKISPRSTRLLISAESSSDGFRFLRLAAIALDGPQAPVYAKPGAGQDEGMGIDGPWNQSAELTRHARGLLHYAQN